MPSLPPPPRQLLKRRLTGDSEEKEWPPWRVRAVALIALFLVVVAIGISVGVVVGRKHHAPVPLALSEDDRVSLHWSNRIIALHARVANAMKGRSSKLEQQRNRPSLTFCSDNGGGGGGEGVGTSSNCDILRLPYRVALAEDMVATASTPHVRLMAFDALAKADADEAAHAAERFRGIEEEQRKRGKGDSTSSLSPSKASTNENETEGVKTRFALTQSLIDRTADPSGALLVTWANAHHYDFALNWIAHVAGAARMRNYLVGCLDDELALKLEEAGHADNIFRIPGFDHDLDARSSGTDGEEIGWGSERFHELGRIKVSLARSLVERHGADIFLSDVDAVFLRDPFEYLRRFPEADVLVSTDALAPTRDRRRRREGLEAPDPLERWPAAAAAANIGLAFFKSPRSASFLREWDENLSQSDRSEAEGGKEGGRQWDQNVFNDLMRRGMRPGEGGRETGEGNPSSSLPPPPPPTPRPDGLFPAFDNSLLFGILPVDLFASGHSFFVQRLPERTGAGVGLVEEGEGRVVSASPSPSPPPSGPFVVHATFQFSGNAGKRHRMRERFLWAVDDDDDEENPSTTSYYNPRGGLLVVEPPPASVLGPAIAAAAAERERMRAWTLQRQRELDEREDEKDEEERRSSDSERRNSTGTREEEDPAALFSAHFALVHLQLRHVVSGLALASALNRTLVLPKLWCGADRWFAPLLAGAIPGAAGPLLPFRCPADHVLDLEAMERTRREHTSKMEAQKGEGEEGEGEGNGVVDSEHSRRRRRLLFPPPPIREASFLLNPKTPRSVKEDVLHVATCRDRNLHQQPKHSQEDCFDGSSEDDDKSKKKKNKFLLSRPTVPDTLHLRSGLDEQHLVKALAPHSHRRVLSFSSEAATVALSPSAGFFSDPVVASAFEASSRTWTSTWCCVNKHPGHVWYDAFAESVPHVDRWGRAWDRPWVAVAGP